VETDGGNPPEPLRAVTSLEAELGLLAAGGSSHTWRGQERFGYPLQGTGLLPPVGSPVARNERCFSLALAIGAKLGQLHIIPPSPIAIAHNGCDFSVLLKYKTATSGAPLELY